MAATGPLQVLVVGAGIEGLIAALALQREGHRVEVFETSGPSPERRDDDLVHLPPNVNAILSRFELDGRQRFRRVNNVRSASVLQIDDCHHIVLSRLTDSWE